MSCRYVSFMDVDPQEIKVGSRAYIEYLKSHPRYSSVAGIIELNVKDNEWGIKDIGAMIPLTFSFTERPDSDYHWEKYAKNDGYAVAFSQRRLDIACDEVARKDGVSLMLVPCFYKEKDQREIEQIFNSLTEDLNDALSVLLHAKNYDSKEARSAGLEILFAIRQMSLGIKGNDFKDDKEWRLVMVSPCNFRLDPDNGFRGTGLKRYCENNDLMYLMDGVAIAPKGNKTRLMDGLIKYGLQVRKRSFKVYSVYDHANGGTQ